MNSKINKNIINFLNKYNLIFEEYSFEYKKLNEEEYQIDLKFEEDQEVTIIFKSKNIKI